MIFPLERTRMLSSGSLLKRFLSGFLFSIIKKSCITTHCVLGVNHFIIQLLVLISGMELVAMIDDKTVNMFVSNPNSSGKEFILISLFWKQFPWKPSLTECAITNIKRTIFLWRCFSNC